MKWHSSMAHLTIAYLEKVKSHKYMCQSDMHLLTIGHIQSVRRLISKGLMNRMNSESTKIAVKSQQVRQATNRKNAKKNQLATKSMEYLVMSRL